MFKVIELFRDLNDGGYLYKVGDTYPRKGHKPEPGRIEELSSSSNKRGTPLIVEVKAEEPKEVETETVEVEEKPKKAKKKATKKK